MKHFKFIWNLNCEKCLISVWLLRCIWSQLLPCGRGHLSRWESGAGELTCHKWGHASDKGQRLSSGPRWTQFEPTAFCSRRKVLNARLPIEPQLFWSVGLSEMLKTLPVRTCSACCWVPVSFGQELSTVRVLFTWQRVLDCLHNSLPGISQLKTSSSF